MAEAFLLGIGGGGPSTVLSAVTLSSNGTYYPSQFSVDGFSEVTVNVSGSNVFTLDDFDFIYPGDVTLTAAEYLRIPGNYSGLMNITFTGATITVPLRSRTTSCNGIFIASNLTTITAYTDGGTTTLYSLYAPNLTRTSWGQGQGYLCKRIYAPKLTNISGQIIGGSVYNLVIGNLTSIGNSAFYNGVIYSNYLNVEHVTYVGPRNNYTAGPDRLIFVSYNVALQTNAFSINAAIREIVINTSNIPANCFYNCSNLFSIKLTASSVTTLTTNAFIATAISQSSIYGAFGSVWVPSSLYDTYKSYTNWITYSNRIVSY